MSGKPYPEHNSVDVILYIFIVIKIVGRYLQNIHSESVLLGNWVKPYHDTVTNRSQPNFH